MNARNAILGILFVLIIATSIHAASFDCGKAASEVERLICGNEELSKLDESLNKAYLRALERTDIKEKTIKSQRQWLKNERNACQNAECLKNAYQTQIKELGLSSYGIVIESPSKPAESASESPPDVSKPQPIEPSGKAVETEPGQQHKPTAASANEAPAVNRVRKKAKKAEKQRTSFDEYVLVMSKDDCVCRHMLRIYNEDLKEHGEIKYDQHEEFKAIKWEKQKAYFEPGKSLLKEVDILISKFEINNDGSPEIIIKDEHRTLSGWDSDAIYIFREKDFTDFKDRIVINDGFFKKAIGVWGVDLDKNPFRANVYSRVPHR